MLYTYQILCETLPNKHLAVNFMSKLTGITHLVKHGAGAIKKVAVSVSEAVNLEKICFSTEPKTFRNNVVFVLSRCSLCGVRLAIAKRKFEKHYLRAIALTQELKSINLTISIYPICLSFYKDPSSLPISRFQIINLRIRIYLK